MWIYVTYILSHILAEILSCISGLGKAHRLCKLVIMFRVGQGSESLQARDSLVSRKEIASLL